MTSQSPASPEPPGREPPGREPTGREPPGREPPGREPPGWEPPAGKVAVCVIRFRRQDTAVVMTVTTSADLERGGSRSSFSTVRVEDVLATIRAVAREVGGRGLGEGCG